jgi:putative transposase
VRDANGQALAYAYYEDDPGRRSAAKLLSQDEARRIAANIAKLPELLRSDNGPSYVSSELGDWLEDNGISHIRGRPYHPMTQGKIERYHRSMKNRILLENYYLPGQLEHSIDEFVEYYNNCRYHESLDNLTPADVYFRRGPAILKRREAIKRKTIEQRRRLHQQAIAA